MKYLIGVMCGCLCATNFCNARAAEAPVTPVVPGLEVRELALKLPNINNLVVNPEGRIFALGYNGNVWELSDTNSDQLEDHASLFWDNKGGEIPASIGMAWSAGGLLIPCKGRVVFLRDQGNGRAALETITENWVPPAKFGGSSLDAVGITADAAGNIYFGLGCDDWTMAYRTNAAGGSDYRIESERGTILKWDAATKKREILATGLRWPVNLAFNSLGDLFCTDQEGATWLPNGNPFDELLHIQRGRHYGFPPRHPKYLPDVIDEPSTFDYGPQHQSTCGLHFNDPHPATGKIFGPQWWKGHAIVSGQSRGKIWLTRLHKTAAGYVAHNQLLASLNLLLIDATPTADGGLLATCHTGAPDWGTGPQGAGRLFKIRYANPTAPQPVMAHWNKPGEIQVAFDRPVPLEWVKGSSKATVVAGRYVSQADRLEKVRPGYQVVMDQSKAERRSVRVLSSALSGDGRTLSIFTEPQSEAVNYGLSIPWSGEGSTDAVDLLVTHHGVEVNAGGKVSWRPSLDSAVSSHFLNETMSKSPKQRRNVKQVLRTQLDLRNMLRAAVQPGSQLDYEYPRETVIVSLQWEGNGSLALEGIKNSQVQKKQRQLLMTFDPESVREWIPITLVATMETQPKISVSWWTTEDARPRPMPLHRMLMPWAQSPGKKVEPSLKKSDVRLSGGSIEAGRKLFLSEKLACSTCHRIRNEGGEIGPDLSNLVHRDYDSVMRDILDPNAAINPEHVAYRVMTDEGEIFVGLVESSTAERILLKQGNGQTQTIARTNVKSVEAASLSLMPAGLTEGMSAKELKDLMAYLLH